MRLLRWCTVGSFVLGGCDAPGQVPPTVVRDSMGITVVENAPRPVEEPNLWRVSAQPVLQIGVADGDPPRQFQFANSAVRLDDGRLVVADAGSAELRAFDATGGHLWSVGRRGEGPGEFRNLGWVQRGRADSLVVYDRSLRRLSVFTDDGTFVRSHALEPVGGTYVPRAVGALADGSVLVHALNNATPSMPEGVNRPAGWAARYSPAGKFLDSITGAPGLSWYMFQVAGRGGVLAPLPFGRDARFAVRGVEMYIGDTERFEVRVFSPTGALQRIVRVIGPNPSLSGEDLDRYRSERLAAARDDNARRSLASMLEETPFPDTYPAFRSFLLDGVGNLWVEAYQQVGDSRHRFHVFDPAGMLVGHVDLPSDLRVLDIGDDYVLGRWLDELDVEYFRLYALEK